MNAYKHLLLALDFGSDNQDLLDRVKSLVSLHQARLTLLHVVEYQAMSYGGDINLPDDIGLDKLLLEKGQAQLEELASTLDLTELNCRTELGVPKHEITRIAQEIHADLIVVGSHGRHGLQLLLGSTANGVLHLAGCDVLAVRMHDDD